MLMLLLSTMTITAQQFTLSGKVSDEDGNAIKKGTLNERIRYSWIGLTEGVLDKGTEDLSSIRTKVTPYVIPIPTDRVMSSNGVLSNDGYAIRNK